MQGDRDPADDIHHREDAGRDEEWEPVPIVQVDVIKVWQKIKNFLARWL